MRPTHRAWPTRDVLRIAAVLVGVFAAVALLWTASSVLLLAFLGILFGLAIASVVDWLERFRVPRAIGTAAVVLATMGLLLGLGRLAAPTVIEQSRAISERLPELADRFRGWLDSQRGGVVGLLTRDTETPSGQRAAKPAAPITERVMHRFGDIGKRFFTIFSSTLSALAGMLLVLFVAVYIAVEPKVYTDGIMHLIPHRSRRRAREILGRVSYMLRRWLLAQIVAMIAVGTLTAVLLMLLGVEGALALGIIAGLLEFVPIIGPIVSAIPGIGMALLSGVDTAFYVTLVYVGVQQAEENLIIPLVMKEGLGLPPVLTIVAQAMMAIVFGILGLLVAVPLLGAIVVAVKMMYVRDVIGDRVPIPGEPAPSSA